jgi:plasmid stabilization system protein ParE
MSRRLTVRPAAVSDVRNGAEWYASIDAKLNHRYVKELDRIFERIRQMPTQFSTWPARPLLHRALVRAFPYMVVFSFDDMEVVIVAVIHVKRKP